VARGEVGTLRVGVSPALGPAEREALVRALRDDAPELSVALREVRPEDVAAALREREIDIAVVRTPPATREVTSAELTPTPGRLYAPVDHPLAVAARPVDIPDLDGERLLTWNAPGTPLTDLLVARLAAGGARVEPVVARISGMSSSLADLSDLKAVAIGPTGWPGGDGVVELQLTGAVELPLFVLWRTGTPPPAVHRLVEPASGVAALE
jgi:DNA-binding transcriptional LysR family regulator